MNPTGLRPGPRPSGNRRALGLLWVFLASLLPLSLLFRLPAVLAGAGGVGALLSPSPDAAALVLAVCLYRSFRLPRFGMFAAVLAAVGAALLAFQFADALVPRFFNRPFQLFTDVTYLPDLYALLRDTLAAVPFYTGLVLLAVLPFAVGLALYSGLQALGRCFTVKVYRYAFLTLLGALALLGLLCSFPLFSNSAVPRLAEELGKLTRREAYLQQQREAPEARIGSGQRRERIARPLDRLEGRNVFLFVVESYGYTVYSEPEHFAGIEQDLLDFEKRLEGAGFQICSNFLTSPAFGGNSWLADSTLATGVWVDNEAAYRVLLDSEVKPVAQYFNEAGYRTVLVMPATTYDWPEGAFYRFAVSYYYKDFAYNGPNLKWAPMTDQYVLDMVHRREVRPAAAAGQPLFVEYVLISSHYPFNLIPRYFEDWSMIGDGSIYRRKDAVTVLPIPAGHQTAGSAGYLEAIRYELTLLGEYLSRFVEGQALVVMIGDHQPYSGITGRNKLRSVPVHLISRNAELLRPFLAKGFTQGVVPRQAPPHEGLDTFLPLFLDSLSSFPAAVSRR